MAGYGPNDTPVDEEAPALGAYSPKDKPATGALRRVGDAGIALARGIIGLPEAAVGVADLVTGGQAGKLAEDVGVRFKDAKDFLAEGYSSEQQAANANVAEAKGFVPTLGAMAKNPSTIVNATLESAPSMIGGVPVARGVMAARGLAYSAEQLAKMTPAARAAAIAASERAAISAGAAGEGVVSAGQNAEQVRQEEPSGTLTPGQAAILGASGVATGAIGFGAGKLANRLGIGEASTMLAAGKMGPVGEEAVAAGARKGLVRKAAEGAAVEGALQELPQSWEEQVAQNIAQGKPWDEGAGAAAAQGLLVGGVMGGVAGPLHSEAAPPPPAPAPAGPITTALGGPPKLPALPAPVVTVDAQGNAVRSGTPVPFPSGPITGALGFDNEPTGTLVADSAGTVREEKRAEVVDRVNAGRIQQGDILGEQDLPFQGAVPAARAARAKGAGFTVAKVDGGYVVRPVGDVTDVQVKPTSTSTKAPDETNRQADAAAKAAPAGRPETAPQGAAAAPATVPSASSGAAETVPAGYGAESSPGAGADTNQALISVDDAAHAAATSPRNPLPEPTEGQKQAGNYTKGHTRIAGMDLSIENPQGSTRSGTDAQGKPWSTTMRHHYGYVKRTEGADGDHVDVFVKPGTPENFSGSVYVVDQVDPKTKAFDEHKAVIGAKSQAEAERIYRSNYGKGWKGMSAVTAMPVEDFKTWVRDGKKGEPAAAAQGPQPLRVGMTPADALPVTVRAGVVHIGEKPAVNFESGDDVTVPEGAGEVEIRKALKDAGALSRRQRIFGGQPEAAKPVAQPAAEIQNAPAPNSTAPASQVAPAAGLEPGATPPASNATPAATEAPPAGGNTVQQPQQQAQAKALPGLTYHGQGGKTPEEGGKPFKNRIAASKYQSEHMKQGRVVKAPDGEGWLVRDPTDNELAARVQAGNRMQAEHRARSRESNPLLAWMADKGLGRALKSQLSPDADPSVKGYGKVFRDDGMEIDLLAERAVEDGFLAPGAEHSTRELTDLMARAIAGQRVIPQYAQGAVEQEMARQLQEHPELSDLTTDDLAAEGYDQADPQLQAMVRELIDQAEKGKVDYESILEDLARKHQNASTDEFNALARAALEVALAAEAGASTQDRGGPAAAQAPEPQASEVASPAQAPPLTAPYASLAGKNVTVEVALEGGKTAKVTYDAQQILLDLDKRAEALREVQERCQ